MDGLGEAHSRQKGMNFMCSRERRLWKTGEEARKIKQGTAYTNLAGAGEESGF